MTMMVADTQITMPNRDGGNPLLTAIAATLPLHRPHHPNAPTPRSPRKTQLSKTSIRQHPPKIKHPLLHRKKQQPKKRSKNQTTLPRANSPPKQTPSQTPPSSSNTTNPPTPAYPLPPRHRGAYTSSKAPPSSTRSPCTSAPAGSLGAKKQSSITRLSIRASASSMRWCSFDKRRGAKGRWMSGGL